MAVRFVRGGGVAGSGVRLQEWRSELTGRVYEVDERDGYATADALQPGSAGYLSFLGGTPVVTRRRDDPPPAPSPRHTPRALRSAPARAPARGARLWILLLAAVAAAVLFRLVGR